MIDQTTWNNFKKDRDLAVQSAKAELTKEIGVAIYGADDNLLHTPEGDKEFRRMIISWLRDFKKKYGVI